MWTHAFRQSFLFRSIANMVIMAFIASLSGPLSYAQEAVVLPPIGQMITITPHFEPPQMVGLRVNLKDPFTFDFIMDQGQNLMPDEARKAEFNKIIKYFLVSLAMPNRDMWVNLSPYESTRIIPEVFAQTEMGRDLLAQDYTLKQFTASLMYPENGLGKKFWDKVYAQAKERFGTTDINVNTFNKVWIMADRADIYQKDDTAILVDSHLKVMLDRDYLATQKHGTKQMYEIASSGLRPPRNDDNSQIMREIIIPAIEREVNEGKNFAVVRQVYQAEIMATWYKKALETSLLNQVFGNSSKIAGQRVNDPQAKEKIYEAYLKAYKKGVFNYIKDEATPDGQMMPRKYFSGGMENVNPSVINTRLSRAMMTHLIKNLKTLSTKGRLVLALASFLTLSGNAFANTNVQHDWRTEKAGMRMMDHHVKKNMMTAEENKAVADAQAHMERAFMKEDALKEVSKERASKGHDAQVVIEHEKAVLQEMKAVAAAKEQRLIAQTIIQVEKQKAAHTSAPKQVVAAVAVSAPVVATSAHAGTPPPPPKSTTPPTTHASISVVSTSSSTNLLAVTPPSPKTTPITNPPVTGKLSPVKQGQRIVASSAAPPKPPAATLPARPKYINYVKLTEVMIAASIIGVLLTRNKSIQNPRKTAFVPTDSVEEIDRKVKIIEDELETKKKALNKLGNKVRAAFDARDRYPPSFLDKKKLTDEQEKIGSLFKEKENNHAVFQKEFGTLYNKIKKQEEERDILLDQRDALAAQEVSAIGENIAPTRLNRTSRFKRWITRTTSILVLGSLLTGDKVHSMPSKKPVTMVPANIEHQEKLRQFVLLRKHAPLVQKDKYGGINLSDENLTINIKVDGKGLPLAAQYQDKAMLHLNGLTSVIRRISPITAENVPAVFALIK